MERLLQKTWVRALFLALFFLCSAAGIVCFHLYSFALEDGWYSQRGEDLDFSDSGMCRTYIEQSLNYVISNIRWMGDPTDEELGGYGGRAFSYVVTNTDTGEIAADTREENSLYVMTSPEYIAAGGDNWNDGYIYSISGYVNLPIGPYDGCYREYFIFEHLSPLRGFFLPGTIVLALAAVAFFAFSLAAAVIEGKGGRLTRLGRLPFDGAVLGFYLLFALIQWAIYRTQSTGYNTSLWQIEQTLYTLDMYPIAASPIFGTWYVSLLALALVNQACAKVLREKLLLFRAVKRVSSTVLTVALCAVHVLMLAVGFLLTATDYSYLFECFLTLFIYDLAVIPCVLLWTVESRRIRQASDALARGDLAYKVNTRRLHLIWKDLGQDLNSIGDGMAKAVDERLRSERMKTELITNVSHDLKTPLTSIINYIELLKNEDLPLETRREYLAILDKHSAKLKKLTEDVIEASKAVSGVMTVNAEVFDVRELLAQSVGEFSERLTEAGIEPIIHLPEQETYILADGRLLGRVLDNFITNIIKYALAGTRAYFDLFRQEGRTYIHVKNTSRDPLDMPAEELMERFVRGDSARSTEGSGLGLSIARSLTELMGGQMRLILDGDLFKAEISFPDPDPALLPGQNTPPSALAETARSGR